MYLSVYSKMDDDEEFTEFNVDDNEYDISTNELEGDFIMGIEEFKKDYESLKKTNITTPNLNKYELTRVLCERTTQLENGSIPYISNPDRFTNTYSIALEELKQRKIPFIIRRPAPNQVSYEYWKLKDMIY